MCNVSGLGTVFLVEGVAGKVALKLYRRAFKYASVVFFQNRDDKELFTSKVLLPPEKVGLLPGSGINLEEFKYSKPDFGQPTKFLMVSRLITEKGVREYAEAASSFAGDENVQFTLVGKFDENHSRSIAKEDLQRWTKEGWVKYLPHSDEIKTLISEHEVVVLPSYREGTPRTLLESAAMGRPLLAADVPGCNEVVQDGVNGFLFKVRSSKSLVQKINLYLSLSLQERSTLSKSSRELVEERFDEKHVIKSYQKAIQRLTSST